MHVNINHVALELVLTGIRRTSATVPKLHSMERTVVKVIILIMQSAAVVV